MTLEKLLDEFYKENGSSEQALHSHSEWLKSVSKRKLKHINP